VPRFGSARTPIGWRTFEKPPKPGEHETQLKKKRAELARVQEHLLSTGLSQGVVRELRKLVTNLERDIAELMRDEE
jgi:hypothetical protein